MTLLLRADLWPLVLLGSAVYYLLIIILFFFFSFFFTLRLVIAAIWMLSRHLFRSRTLGHNSQWVKVQRITNIFGQVTIEGQFGLLGLLMGISTLTARWSTGPGFDSGSRWFFSYRFGFTIFCFKRKWLSKSFNQKTKNKNALLLLWFFFFCVIIFLVEIIKNTSNINKC